MLKLSVIIANFNYLRFLRTCIESVLAQDYPSFELIVVDDCSTDGSRDLIRNYAREGRITRIFHETNKGQGGAFNSGYAKAGGDIIMFLDADDFLLPGALWELNRSFSKNVVQYQFRMQLVDEVGVPYDIFPQPEIAMDSGPIAGVVLAKGRYNTTVTSGLAFSASVLQELMPMDAEAFQRGADGYLSIIVPLYGEVRSIEKTLSAYRQHGDNHSQFSKDLVKRANWCLEHDANRYTALRSHAKKLGLRAHEPLGDADILHLEQRMILILLDPECPPYEKAKRYEIASLAIRALSQQGNSGGRNASLKLWWWALATLPIPLAGKLLQWKLESTSRPQIVKILAKTIRQFG